METKGAGQIAFMHMMRDQCERWSDTVDFFWLACVNMAFRDPSCAVWCTSGGRDLFAYVVLFYYRSLGTHFLGWLLWMQSQDTRLVCKKKIQRTSSVSFWHPAGFCKSLPHLLSLHRRAEGSSQKALCPGSRNCSKTEQMHLYRRKEAMRWMHVYL